VPDEERKLAQSAIDRAVPARQQPERTYVDQLRYSDKVSWMTDIKTGHWVIPCVREGRGAEVWPPQQLLSIESYKRYSRGRDRRRWVLQFEAPRRGAPVRLRQFQRAIRRAAPSAGWGGVRTKPIYDSEVADAMLRLWTQTGKPSAKALSRAG
jgi:hypothetical protein